MLRNHSVFCSHFVFNDCETIFALHIFLNEHSSPDSHLVCCLHHPACQHLSGKIRNGCCCPSLISAVGILWQTQGRSGHQSMHRGGVRTNTKGIAVTKAKHWTIKYMCILTKRLQLTPERSSTSQQEKQLWLKCSNASFCRERKRLEALVQRNSILIETLSSWLLLLYFDKRRNEIHQSGSSPVSLINALFSHEIKVSLSAMAAGKLCLQEGCIYGQNSRLDFFVVSAGWCWILQSQIVHLRSIWRTKLTTQKSCQEFARRLQLRKWLSDKLIGWKASPKENHDWPIELRR